MLKTIRARSIIVVAVAVLLATAIAPPPRATAAPQTDILTDFYDCALNQVGEKFRGCDSTGYNQGQLSGYFKEIESCSCGGTTCTYSWWRWNGSGWDYLGTSEPLPEC